MYSNPSILEVVEDQLAGNWLPSLTWRHCWSGLVQAIVELFTQTVKFLEVLPFQKFWMAEAYHQDYERLNPEQPYIRGVSVPRFNRFASKYPELLKEGAAH